MSLIRHPRRLWLQGVFGLRLSQTEGLISSIIRLLALAGARLFVQVLGHFQVLLQCRQGPARPVFQLHIATILAVALE
jgi:hypothetical protein